MDRRLKRSRSGDRENGYNRRQSPGRLPSRSRESDYHPGGGKRTRAEGELTWHVSGSDDVLTYIPPSASSRPSTPASNRSPSGSVSRRDFVTNDDLETKIMETEALAIVICSMLQRFKLEKHGVTGVRGLLGELLNRLNPALAGMVKALGGERGVANLLPNSVVRRGEKGKYEVYFSTTLLSHIQELLRDGDLEEWENALLEAADVRSEDALILEQLGSSSIMATLCNAISVLQGASWKLSHGRHRLGDCIDDVHEALTSANTRSTAPSLLVGCCYEPLRHLLETLDDSLRGEDGRPGHMNGSGSRGGSNGNGFDVGGGGGNYDILSLFGDDTSAVNRAFDCLEDALEALREIAYCEMNPDNYDSADIERLIVQLRESRVALRDELADIESQPARPLRRRPHPPAAADYADALRDLEGEDAESESAAEGILADFRTQRQSLPPPPPRIEVVGKDDSVVVMPPPPPAPPARSSNSSSPALPPPPPAMKAKVAVNLEDVQDKLASTDLGPLSFRKRGKQDAGSTTASSAPPPPPPPKMAVIGRTSNSSSPAPPQPFYKNSKFRAAGVGVSAAESAMEVVSAWASAPTNVLSPPPPPRKVNSSNAMGAPAPPPRLMKADAAPHKDLGALSIGNSSSIHLPPPPPPPFIASVKKVPFIAPVKKAPVMALVKKEPVMASSTSTALVPVKMEAVEARPRPVAAAPPRPPPPPPAIIAPKASAIVPVSWSIDPAPSRVSPDPERRPSPAIKPLLPQPVKESMNALAIVPGAGVSHRASTPVGVVSRKSPPPPRLPPQIAAAVLSEQSSSQGWGTSVPQVAPPPPPAWSIDPAPSPSMSAPSASMLTAPPAAPVLPRFPDIVNGGSVSQVPADQSRKREREEAPSTYSVVKKLNTGAAGSRSNTPPLGNAAMSMPMNVDGVDGGLRPPPPPPPPIVTATVAAMNGSKSAPEGAGRWTPPPHNIQPTSQNIQPSPQNMQHNTHNMQPHNIQSATHDIQPFTHNMQPNAQNIQPAMQHVSHNMRADTHNIQPQPDAHNMQQQPTAHNIQHNTQNIQAQPNTQNMQQHPQNFQHTSQDMQHISHNIQPHAHNMQQHIQQNEQNVQHHPQNVQHTSHNIQPITQNIQSYIQQPNPHHIQSLTQNLQHIAHNMQPRSQNIQQNMQPNAQNIQSVQHNMQSQNMQPVTHTQNMQPHTQNIQHTPHNMQPHTHNIQPRNIQPPYYEQPNTQNVQPHNIQPQNMPANEHNMQPHTQNMQPHTQNMQTITHNMQPNTQNMQPIQQNMQPMTHNVEPQAASHPQPQPQQLQQQHPQQLQQQHPQQVQQQHPQQQGQLPRPPQQQRKDPRQANLLAAARASLTSIGLGGAIGAGSQVGSNSAGFVPPRPPPFQPPMQDNNKMPAPAPQPAHHQPMQQQGSWPPPRPTFVPPALPVHVQAGGGMGMSTTPQQSANWEPPVSSNHPHTQSQVTQGWNTPIGRQSDGTHGGVPPNATFPQLQQPMMMQGEMGDQPGVNAPGGRLELMRRESFDRLPAYDSATPPAEEVEPVPTDYVSDGEDSASKTKEVVEQQPAGGYMSDTEDDVSERVRLRRANPHRKITEKTRFRESVDFISYKSADASSRLKFRRERIGTGPVRDRTRAEDGDHEFRYRNTSLPGCHICGNSHVLVCVECNKCVICYREGKFGPKDCKPDDADWSPTEHSTPATIGQESDSSTSGGVDPDASAPAISVDVDGLSPAVSHRHHHAGKGAEDQAKLGKAMSDRIDRAIFLAFMDPPEPPPVDPENPDKKVEPPPDPFQSILALMRTTGLYNFQRKKGETALHAAAYQGRADMCKQLMKLGADRTLRDSHGNSPYDLACARKHSNLAVMLAHTPQTAPI